MLQVNRAGITGGWSHFLMQSVCGCILLSTVAVSSTAQDNDTNAPVLLKGATIIDGVSDTALTGYSLLIEGNTILDVVSSTATVPANATVIDLQGKYIIPGLIDSHVHWQDWMGELFLNHGVTSIVALTEFEREKRMESQTSLTVPRLFHTGGRPEFENDDSPAEIRKVIKDWLKKEPDMAHFETYNDESSRAHRIAAEAVHEQGYLLFSHTENVIESIRAGHDIVEHVWGFTQAAMTDSELTAFQSGENLTWATYMTGRWEQLEQMIRDAVAAGVYLNPTMIYEWGGMSKDADRRELQEYRLLTNPDLVYYPTNVAISLLAKHRQIKNFSSRYENTPFVSKLPAEDRKQFQEGYENVQRFVRTYVEAGGKIQAGTDTISGGIPGLGLHQEMEMLVEAGLTPMQAIRSATRWSAEILEGKNGKRGPAPVGSLAKGKRADLVVLSADPLQDISNTQKIDRVMKEGNWLTPGYHPEYYTFTRPSRSIAGATGAPDISSVTPAMLDAGQPDTRVVIEGSGFMMTSLIRIDGISVKTDFINPRRLEFDLPASLIKSPEPNPYAAPGPYQKTGIVGFRSIEVEVFNPPPEGGISNAVRLMIRP